VLGVKVDDGDLYVRWNLDAGFAQHLLGLLLQARSKCRIGHHSVEKLVVLLLIPPGLFGYFHSFGHLDLLTGIWPM